MEKCKHVSRRKVTTELGTYYVCDACNKEMVSPRRFIENLWIKQRFYQSRGAVYTGQVMGLYNTIQTGGILLLIFGGDKAREIALWVFILGWMAQTLFETLMGRRDYKKWKLIQREQILSTSYSPFTIEMFERIKNIEKVVSPQTYKEESILDEYKK